MLKMRADNYVYWGDNDQIGLLIKRFNDAKTHVIPEGDQKLRQCMTMLETVVKCKPLFTDEFLYKTGGYKKPILKKLTESKSELAVLGALAALCDARIEVSKSQPNILEILKSTAMTSLKARHPLKILLQSMQTEAQLRRVIEARGGESDGAESTQSAGTSESDDDALSLIVGKGESKVLRYRTAMCLLPHVAATAHKRAPLLELV